MKKATKFLIFTSRYILIMVLVVGMFGILNQAKAATDVEACRYVYTTENEQAGDIVAGGTRNPDGTVTSIDRELCNILIAGDENHSPGQYYWGTQQQATSQLGDCTLKDKTTGQLDVLEFSELHCHATANDPIQNVTFVSWVKKNADSSDGSTSGGLVPCDNSAGSLCDFAALMKLINKVIDYALFKLTLPCAAIGFGWAGWELVTSGGSTEKLGTAKNIFTNTCIGLVIALAAWLIVSLLFALVGFDASWIGFTNGV